MSDKYLVLNASNEVVNIIVYNGVAEYNPGEGLSLMPHPKNPEGSQDEQGQDLPEYVYVNIGSILNEDDSWTHPEPTPPAE
jgi:hypothetical protein